MAAKLANMDGVRVSTYPGLNKRAWGEGPWLDEPDQVEWNVGAYACAVRRDYLGVFCGYVGLPPGHPWWGLDDVPAQAHGGLTFAEQTEQRYWIGFDCGHGAIDFVPGLPCPYIPGLTYRTVEWVMGQVENLAAQCALATSAVPAISSGER